jgi:hypothetical protein
MANNLWTSDPVARAELECVVCNEINDCMDNCSLDCIVNYMTLQQETVWKNPISEDCTVENFLHWEKTSKLEDVDSVQYVRAEYASEEKDFEVWKKECGSI